jgi:hypothetical protein
MTSSSTRPSMDVNAPTISRRSRPGHRGKPGRSADRPTIPIAPPARPVRSAPTAGRIAGTASRAGGSRPSVARSRSGFGRPGSAGTGAVGPPRRNADRAGRDGTEPGRFPPRRTAQSSRPEPAMLRASVSSPEESGHSPRVVMRVCLLVAIQYGRVTAPNRSGGPGPKRVRPYPCLAADSVVDRRRLHCRLSSLRQPGRFPCSIGRRRGVRLCLMARRTFLAGT